MRQVNDLSKTVTNTVSEQRNANTQINRSIHDAAVGTREVTQATTTVWGAVRETGDAAGQMPDAAVELSRMAELLRSEVDRFSSIIQTGPRERSRTTVDPARTSVPASDHSGFHRCTVEARRSA